MVEDALEGAFQPISGAHDPSVHPLDGEYTRCPLKSYETCVVFVALVLSLVAYFLFFFNAANAIYLHRDTLLSSPRCYSST